MKLTKVELKKLELQPGDVLEVSITDKNGSAVDIDRIYTHLKSILPEGIVPLVYKQNQLDIHFTPIQPPLIENPAELTADQLVSELIDTASSWGYYSGTKHEMAKIKTGKLKEIYRLELMTRFINPDRYMTIMMLAVETGTNQHTVRVRIQRARESGQLKKGDDFIKIANLLLIRRDKGLSIATGKEKGRGRPRNENRKETD